MLAIHLKMNKELNYNHDISTLNGVGPKIKNTLNSIGLNDLSDLIFYFPRKYNDYRNLKKISDLKDGEEVTIKGKILFGIPLGDSPISPEACAPIGLKYLKFAIFHSFF